MTGATVRMAPGPCRRCLTLRAAPRGASASATPRCRATPEPRALSDGGVAPTVAGPGAASRATSSRAFDPVARVVQRLTCTEEVTALVPAISRDVARGRREDPTAQSAPDAGSMFTVTRPRACSGVPPREAARWPPSRTPRIPRRCL